MAKDPAFLFYFSDFLTSTDLMTAEELGCYIRILCHMADKGRLRQEQILSICKAYPFTYALQEHLKIDQDGLYFHPRLEEEVQKRKNYTQSRRENAKAYAKHMENRNRDENRVANPSKPTKTTFNFDILWDQYPNKLGKKDALRHFKASVITEDHYQDIQTALSNYIEKAKTLDPQFIKHGSSWFNNWKDWIDYKKPDIAKKDENGVPMEWRTKK